jgi:hypothetical protein
VHFRWPPAAYAGEFSVQFDSEPTAERYRFYADGAGQIQFTPPLHHSPLGVPATYSAVETSEAVDAAILRALRFAIPALKPYGLDPETGALITTSTPLSKRLLMPLEPGLQTTVSSTEVRSL